MIVSAIRIEYDSEYDIPFWKFLARDYSHYSKDFQMYLWDLYQGDKNDVIVLHDYIIVFHREPSTKRIFHIIERK